MNKQEIEKAVSKLVSDIGALQNYLRARPSREWEHCFEEELIKDIQLAISAINQLNNRWILVSERLPENDSHVLASFDDGFVATVDYVDDDFELWYGSGEPVAWMETPEPYKGVFHDRSN
jgi:hypothetical protein